MAYLVLMIGIGFWARGRIHDAEDFLVAGRRLPLLLAWPTLLATWFGAGTLLTATDEVRAHGLRAAALDPLGAGLCLLAAALDPLGAGLCLLAAGWLLARPLWRLRLVTLSDFFRVRFGARAELWSALFMVPTYFGWIAAQFVALAGLLEVIFDLDPGVGIALVAAVGTAYTLLGGMWSVTATDAVQIVLVVLGLVVLTVEVLAMVGGGGVGEGLAALWASLPPERAALVPTESFPDVVGWLGVLAIGALGNLPGQDLMQRVFASRSERTAVWACHLSGASYLVIGALPLVLGLAADRVAPGSAEQSTLPALAGLFLTPWLATILVLAVASAVLSTIDSALLSPASVISENVLRRRDRPTAERLAASRGAVVLVAAVSCLLAYVGASAYELLESAYALGLVSLVVPLLAGVHGSRASERAALWAMAVGCLAWLPHEVLGAETFMPFLFGDAPLPVALCSAGLGVVAYVAAGRT